MPKDVPKAFKPASTNWPGEAVGHRSERDPVDAQPAELIEKLNRSISGSAEARQAEPRPDIYVRLYQVSNTGSGPLFRVSLPRIFLLVPGLLAGFLIPAVGAAPKTPPAIDIGMGNESFARSVETIHRGERLTLANNSRLIHVIGPGHDGQVISPATGVPVLGTRLMQTNSVYTTGPWETPGQYYLTCPVHPRMTLKVVVTP